MDPNDLFGNLTAAPSEDRTEYVRHTPFGPRTDFAVIERTSFDTAFPQTVKVMQTSLPLPCGHHVTRENPFGGYCVLCTQEYCRQCARTCPRCGRSMSGNCCARLFEGLFYCRPCRRWLRIRKVVSACASFLLRPFLERA